MSQTAEPSTATMSVPSASTFSFAAPYPSTSLASGSQLATKQRRVSLALPYSPRLVNAWSFRDDTVIDSHLASGSTSLAPEKKPKMRKTATAIVAADDLKPAEKAAAPVAEKRQRKKWTEEETQMLVNGCNIWGVGNWKAILNDSNLKFDNRSPVDLKDRFRTFFPDAYKLHYPNAKTHLSSKVRSTLPDGTCLFEKTRSKKRRPFTPEEDQALKAGYEKYGTVWSTIVKDPIFQEQKRRSTDLRDRFRNAFPHLYQAAGYKPRSIPKKKRGDASISAPRATADDQLLSTRMTTPARRRRSRMTHGYSYSVPQSTQCSEDEDSSDDDDDEVVEMKRPVASTAIVKETTPQPDGMPYNSESSLNEVTMHTIDQLDPLADMSLPDFMPDSCQTLSDITDQSAWSSDQSPPQMSCWSSAATTTASPTSSQISVNDYFMEPAFSALQRRDGMNMVGKSAWCPTDWLSANPRLDPSGASTSSNSSYIEGPSPPPSSPFSFSHLSHGIMDRYDLFQNSLAHDFASEVGLSDAYSTFSDPELFPTQSLRGFTHHSNYAGDLIFGARTHQPQGPMGSMGSMSSFELALNQNSPGLGLSGVVPPTSGSINPMQLHTPGLPDIDELAAISLEDDDEPMISPTTSRMAEAGVQKDEVDASPLFDNDLSSLIRLPPAQDMEAIGECVNPDASEHESAATPPATPAQASRASRELHVNPYMSLHNRSMSVPPVERVPLRQTTLQPGHATPQPAPSRSLSLFSMQQQPLSHHHHHHEHHEHHGLTQQQVGNNSLQSSHTNSHSHHHSNAHASTASTSTTSSSSFLSTFMNDSFKSLDLSDLLFLDLHAPGIDLTATHHDIIDSGGGETRCGQALDLAHTQAQNGSMVAAAAGVGTTAPTTTTIAINQNSSAPGALGSGLASLATAATTTTVSSSRSLVFNGLGRLSGFPSTTSAFTSPTASTSSSPLTPTSTSSTTSSSASTSNHHRVQSAAVSPKDLILFTSGAKHCKRASWDGMTT